MNSGEDDIAEHQVPNRSSTRLDAFRNVSHFPRFHSPSCIFSKSVVQPSFFPPATPRQNASRGRAPKVGNSSSPRSRQSTNRDSASPPTTSTVRKVPARMYCAAVTSATTKPLQAAVRSNATACLAPMAAWTWCARHSSGAGEVNKKSREGHQGPPEGNQRGGARRGIRLIRQGGD